MTDKSSGFVQPSQSKKGASHAPECYVFRKNKHDAKASGAGLRDTEASDTLPNRSLARRVGLWLATVTQPVAEEIIEFRYVVDLLNRRFHVVLHSTVGNLVSVENYVG